MTLFLNTDGTWMVSERTSIGFKHHKVGKASSMRRDEAIERAREMGLEVA